MSDIVLSSGVRSNLLALQQTSDLISQTQTRLATGKKVNSALDNPTNFFTASSLNSRASDLSSLLDSMSNAIKTIEAADNGLKAITNTVESLQSTVRQARQDNTFQSKSFALSSTASGNLTISGGGLAAAVDVSLEASGATQSTVAGAGAFAAPDAAAAATFTAANAFTNIDLSNDAGDTLTFDIDDGEGNTTTVTLDRAGSGAGGAGGDNTYDIDEAIAEINAQATAAGVNITASKNGAGDTLIFTGDNAGAFTITVDSVAVVDGGGLGANNQAVTDLGISDPATTGQSATGTAAETFTFTVSDGTNTTANIDLTSVNAGDADDAVTVIQAAIDAANISATAVNTGGTISINGLANGTNSITVAGAGVNDVFGGAPTVTAGSSATLRTVDQLVTAIAGDTDLTNAGVVASNDDGELKINFNSTSSTDLTVAGLNTDADTITGGAGSTTIKGNEVRRDLETQFNEIRSQLNKLAEDATFNGINLLEGDALRVVFNEQNTSSLTIQSTSTSGINTTSLSITSVTAGDFATNSALDTRLTALGDALTSLRSQSSAFGSNLSIVENRQEFTKATINTLIAGADNLTLADLNEEGANLLALQTRQQLSTTALSLAAQADQNVLRLF